MIDVEDIIIPGALGPSPFDKPARRKSHRLAALAALVTEIQTLLLAKNCSDALVHDVASDSLLSSFGGNRLKPVCNVWPTTAYFTLPLREHYIQALNNNK